MTRIFEAGAATLWLMEKWLVLVALLMVKVVVPVVVVRMTFVKTNVSGPKIPKNVSVESVVSIS